MQTGSDVLEAIEEKERAALVVERRADGRLWAVRGGEAVPVRLVRCFPWSAPDRHLSLRDERGREVALVREPGELDPESGAALEEALATVSFVIEVLAIEAVEEDFEVRRWQVRTRQGCRRFQTRLDTWPRREPGGGWLVEDVAGDLFRLPPAGNLDPRSRRLVWAFVD
jgi:hypothetical protein